VAPIKMKSLNLLTQAKANTKKIEAITKKEIAQSLKDAKKFQAEQTKAKKSEKQIESDKIKLSWLNDTQSKTALEKYVKDNKEKFSKFLSVTNELNNSNVTINQVNKQLFKFGYSHELNKLDFEGNVIEAKSFFNIAFFVANANSLLNRFAKYKNNTNNDFVSASKKSTENYLDSKFLKLQKNVLLKGAKKIDVQNILANVSIDRNEKASLLKKLITE
jgi:hypothetical protein